MQTFRRTVIRITEPFADRCDSLVRRLIVCRMGQCELLGPKLIVHEMGTRVDLDTIFYALP
jgi:hypothetical protein